MDCRPQTVPALTLMVGRKGCLQFRLIIKNGEHNQHFIHLEVGEYYYIDKTVSEKEGH